MNEHIIWEEYLLGLGIEAKVKELQDEGCPEDTARVMVEQDAKDYREAKRKQHSPMTEAQGERLTDLLEQLVRQTKASEDSPSYPPPPKERQSVRNSPTD